MLYYCILILSERCCSSHVTSACSSGLTCSLGCEHAQKLADAMPKHPDTRMLRAQVHLITTQDMLQSFRQSISRLVATSGMDTCMYAGESVFRVPGSESYRGRRKFSGRRNFSEMVQLQHGPGTNYLLSGVLWTLCTHCLFFLLSYPVTRRILSLINWA